MSTVPESLTAEQSYFIDGDDNQDWIKKVRDLRRDAGQKFGRFVTLGEDEGRVVFIGGPSQGSGGGGGAAAGATEGRLPRAKVVFDEQEAFEAMEAAQMHIEWEGADPYSHVDRVTVKDEIVTEISEISGVPYERVNRVVGTWAQSSNDYNTLSLAVQQEASKVFGSPLSEWQKSKLREMEEHYNSIYPDTMSFQEAMDLNIMAGKGGVTRREIRKVLHAMYDHTQLELERQGVPEVVTLYRGVKRSMSPGKRNIHTNTLSSFSSNPLMAASFSGTGGSIIEMHVPRSRIVGTARTGFGCFPEYEFVILGNNTGSGDEVIIGDPSRVSPGGLAGS